MIWKARINFKMKNQTIWISSFKTWKINQNSQGCKSLQKLARNPKKILLNPRELEKWTWHYRISKKTWISHWITKWVKQCKDFLKINSKLSLCYRSKKVGALKYISLMQLEQYKSQIMDHSINLMEHKSQVSASLTLTNY